MRTHRSSAPLNSGSAAAALVLLGVLMAAATLVLSLATQSSAARSTQSAAHLGRFAGELAESAVDEALSEFPDQLAARLGQQDFRALLLQRAAGGVAPGEAIGGTWAFPSTRTLGLVAECQLAVHLSPVGVRVLYYGTAQNYGEVELSCRASFQLAGKREAHRRVTSRHYYALDANGRRFRINPVPSSFLVDRSGDE
jgi:hypothetical protein